MLIRLGYDIEFEMASAAAMVAMLRVHPSRAANLLKPDRLQTDPPVPVESYKDSFGNICSRFVAPAGPFRLFCSSVIEDSGEPDPVDAGACQDEVQDLPAETLRFLLPSRYCEVDLMANLAEELFSDAQPGWPRVQAICSWVHRSITFGYHLARPTKTAVEVFHERGGVCRDFQHLAITFCRCMGVPARYATGYLGDIGVPASDVPMDFSAWFEAYLGGRWWAFDARHNTPRIGRVLIATGRDAADVAITTSFGRAPMKQFTVVTRETAADEVKQQGLLLG